MAHKKMTMGLIVGNRGFFPDHLAMSGREEMIRVLEAAGIEVVALTPEQSKYGAETGKSPGAAPISSDSIAIASMGS